MSVSGALLPTLVGCRRHYVVHEICPLTVKAHPRAQSLVTQGAHRLDPRRPPSWEGAGTERDERERVHRGNQYHGIGGLELE